MLALSEKQSFAVGFNFILRELSHMIGQSEREQLAFANMYNKLPHKMSACQRCDTYRPISSNFSIVYLSFVIHKLLSWGGNEAYGGTPKTVLALVSLPEMMFIHFWQDQIVCAVQRFSFPQDCHIDPNQKTQQADKSHLSMRLLHVLPVVNMVSFPIC